MLSKHPLYYHTFGAPMATRNKQVSSVLVAKTVSQSSFSSGLDGWVATSNATLSNVYGNIRATVTALNAGMQKTFSTEAGKTYRIRFKVNLRGWPYMYVKDVASSTNLISITDFMTPGDYSYTFTATGYQTNVIFHEAGNASGSVQLASFVLEEVEAEGGYRFGFNGKEKDNETYGDGNAYDFGSRTHDPRLGRWIALDPLTFLSPSKTPYGYAINNPIVMIDTEGEKEKPFENNKSQPITKKAGTETPAFIRNSRGEIIGFQPNAKQAYNCHSYAWHKSSGDISDPQNSPLIQNGITKWDNNPADDIKSTQAKQLSNQDPNKTGDIVIYFLDDNNNGKYDDGEFIEHSAVVKDVDKDGNTITVIGKMGEDAISENHPAAPGYYQTDGDKKVSRAYFRLADNSPTKEAQKEETKKEDTNQKPKFDVEVNKKNDTYVAPSPKIISEPK